MNRPASLRTVVFSVVKHDYIPVAVAAHPRFELVAVCDDPDQPDWVHVRNQQFADRYTIPYLQDFDRVLDRYHPQVAVISSQAERHCALAVRAANAGLHLVVDKPLSTKLSECDRLVEAVETAGVRSLVWNRNQVPALRQTRRALDDGAIGQLRAVHCDFYFAKDAGPAKGTRQPGDPPINWLDRQIEAHADGSDGGVGHHPMGELQVEGIYPLAYLDWLTGLSIQKVFAQTACHFHQAHFDNEVEDLASVTLEMEQGVVGSICLGRIGAASHPDLGEIKLHLLGTRGALVISEPRPEVSVYYRGQPEKEFRHRRVCDENDFLLVDNFAMAIDQGSDTILDVHRGRDICAVIQACLRSAKSNRVQSVDMA